VIRDATEGDLENLLYLGAKMHEESLVYYPPIERESVERYLEAVVSMPEVFLISFAFKDSPIGMITASAGPHAFSSVLRSGCELLYVLPEHRGGRTAMKLVERFKEWSDDLGAVYSTMGVSTGLDPERTGRFFEFMGFEPMERTYRRYNVHRD
jgi:GNAT superfamily N-acetyltransferase